MENIKSQNRFSAKNNFQLSTLVITKKKFTSFFLKKKQIIFCYVKGFRSTGSVIETMENCQVRNHFFKNIFYTKNLLYFFYFIHKKSIPQENWRISLGHDHKSHCALQIAGADSVSIAFTSTSSSSSSFEIVPYEAQREAVLSALTRRLTLIVGPPGTGKTDTAVSMLTAFLVL